MEELNKPIVLDNGTTFTHKEKINNRWYYIGYCGICNESYKAVEPKNKGHRKCLGNNRQLPHYIENDTPIYKHINGELWHNILGFPGYWVNKKGEVLGKKGFKLKLGKNLRGYPIIQCIAYGKKETFRVHRLVAEYFIYNNDPKNKIQVDHINGIKQDNRVENLEWVTNQENHNRKMKMGLNVAPKLENHGSTKLKNKDVIDIYSSEDTDEDIMKKYDISKEIVRDIRSGSTWKSLTKKLPNNKYKERKPVSSSNLLRRDIINIYTTFDTIKNLSNDYSVSKEVIRNIKNDKSFTDITKQYTNAGVKDGRLYDKETVQYIYKSNKEYQVLNKETGVPLYTISNIKNKREYKDYTENIEKGNSSTRREILVEDVIYIYTCKKSIKDLTKELGFSYQAIYNIKNDKSRTNITRKLKKGINING